MAICFSAFAFRQRNKISEKNRALVRMINEQTAAQDALQQDATNEAIRDWCCHPSANSSSTSSG